jgi:hypothetical protein
MFIDFHKKAVRTYLTLYYQKQTYLFIFSVLRYNKTDKLLFAIVYNNYKNKYYKNTNYKIQILFMIAQDMALINTYFKKEENKLVTYSSGGRSSQIEFTACRRRDLKDIQDCAVINGK